MKKIFLGILCSTLLAVQMAPAITPQVKTISGFSGTVIGTAGAAFYFSKANALTKQIDELATTKKTRTRDLLVKQRNQYRLFGALSVLVTAAGTGLGIWGAVNWNKSDKPRITTVDADTQTDINLLRLSAGAGGAVPSTVQGPSYTGPGSGAPGPTPEELAQLFFTNLLSIAGQPGAPAGAPGAATSTQTAQSLAQFAQMFGTGGGSGERPPECNPQ